MTSRTAYTAIEPNQVAKITHRSYGSQMTTIRLECHKEESNTHKYYEMTYYEGSYIVQVRYGRLPGYGRRGTSVHRDYYKHSDAFARSFMEMKLREKYRKGYTDMGEGSVVEHMEEENVPLESEPVQWSGILTRIAHI